uniref:Uncharacterized protein n=1 Tax=Rhizophora mucronata TaxID=61149 RepID=A0A2P2QEG9_RHIMU
MATCPHNFPYMRECAGMCVNKQVDELIPSSFFYILYTNTNWMS